MPDMFAARKMISTMNSQVKDHLWDLGVVREPDGQRHDIQFMFSDIDGVDEFSEAPIKINDLSIVLDIEDVNRLNLVLARCKFFITDIKGGDRWFSMIDQYRSSATRYRLTLEPCDDPTQYRSSPIDHRERNRSNRYRVRK